MPQDADPTIVFMGVEYHLAGFQRERRAYIERPCPGDMSFNAAVGEALRNLRVPIDPMELDGEGSVVPGADGGFPSGKTIEFSKKTPSVKES